MSIRHDCGSVKYALDLTPKIREVGEEALRISRSRYSSGFPDYEGGSERKLGYNNERHNFIMGRDAKRLLQHLGFSAFDQELGRATGEAHDRDQLAGRGIDEYNSAVWLEEQLCYAGVSARLARRSAVAVLGTEPLLSSESVLIDQMVNYLEFDSPQDELWAKAVVSADLSEVYTPIGPYSAHRLYVQVCSLDATETPPMDRLEGFLGRQAETLTGYEYPLDAAEDLFATHRRQVCDYAEFLYDQACAGRIESWTQLTEWDLRFMNNPYIQFSRLA